MKATVSGVVTKLVKSGKTSTGKDYKVINVCVDGSVVVPVKIYDAQKQNSFVEGSQFLEDVSIGCFVTKDGKKSLLSVDLF